MALRFASKAQNAASLGAGSVTHGLPVTPDEYWLVDHTPTHASLLAASAPDGTHIHVTQGAGGVVSIFAAVNHSYVK